MSYAQVLQDVATTLGTAVDGTSVLPANYADENPGDEFIVFSVFPTRGRAVGYGEKAYSGFVEFNIYTAAGTATVRSAQLCDELDSLFDRKTVNDTQFSASRVTVSGLDTANKNLWRVNYFVDFSST